MMVGTVGFIVQRQTWDGEWLDRADYESHEYARACEVAMTEARHTGQSHRVVRTEVIFAAGPGSTL